HLVETTTGHDLVVRVFIAGAASIDLRETDGSVHPMVRRRDEGFFDLVLPGRSTVPAAYTLHVATATGVTFTTYDTYAFPSFLSDYDLYLLGEGTHYRNYERLGAHRRTMDGVDGVTFAVWAPNAKRVSVVGDFNQWDGRRNSMRYHPGVGIWDVFIPGLTLGDKYKYEVLSAADVLLPLRTDPYGFYFEERPATASIVHDLDKYTWNDAAWMESREKRQALDAPLSIYEVHLGSWIRDPTDPSALLSYRDLAHKLVAYVKDLGFTHIELLPVSEHPFDGSWGYQTLGYYAPTSRYGTPDDFRYMVDHCHRNGIGVFVDWVPAHFPRDDHGLRQFDGTALYEHADPRQGEHPEWGTLIFNYGRNEVANFLLGSALFWLDKYHIDGFRVDAVASMLYLDYGREGGDFIPNRYGGNENLEAIQFIKRFNEIVHLHHPGVLTIAEESTSWGGVSRPTYAGGLGFSLKWNMGWMNDTLRYLHRDPLYRRFHQNDLTFSLIYAFTENFMLPLSHDEVVHGKGSLLDKMPGYTENRFANLRLLFGYMWTHPGKKLLYMGGEFGQWQEWRFYQSLDWHLLEHGSHKGVQRLVKDLNRLLKNEPALYEVDFDFSGFEWIDFQDHDNCVLSYMRKAKNEEDALVCVLNFTPVLHSGYRLGVPTPGRYEVVLNSDSIYYDGSNQGNGAVEAEPIACHGRPHSVLLTLPPLTIMVLRVPR
ncbi:MAG: 1,4-alpha-glucan branching protein GlgB, partial [Planctomycetia bacterium]